MGIDFMRFPWRSLAGYFTERSVLDHLIELPADRPASDRMTEPAPSVFGNPSFKIADRENSITAGAEELCQEDENNILVRHLVVCLGHYFHSFLVARIVIAKIAIPKAGILIAPGAFENTRNADIRIVRKYLIN
jgi:hypothetical protein